MGQYIGARYVPRFMGVFDPTQAYENLDVVDNGLGTSYISKAMTPPGTSLTDTTYWALYGASSGAIINLQNQIGDLSDLTTTDQSSLVNAINELDSENQALTNKVNRNVLYLGDSFADANMGGYARGVATVVQTMMGLDNNHFHIFNLGGARFYTNVGSNTFDGVLNLAIADTSYDHNDITDVIIETAFNDIGNGTDPTMVNNIRAAFEALIDRIYAAYPNAYISIAPIASRRNQCADLVYVDQLNNILGTTAKRINIITNASNPMRFLDRFTDHVHPNSYGCLDLGKLIGSAVLSRASIGDFVDSYNHDFRMTIDSALSVYHNPIHDVNGESEKIRFNFNGLIANGSITISTGRYNSILLGTENILVPNTDDGSVESYPILSMPVNARVVINNEYSPLPNAKLLFSPIANDLTKCNVYLGYQWSLASGTATRIEIDSASFEYNI